MEIENDLRGSRKITVCLAVAGYCPVTVCDCFFTFFLPYIKSVEHFGESQGHVIIAIVERADCQSKAIPDTIFKCVLDWQTLYWPFI